mmetsp:Transcript_35876/g.55064  ORF Transcript_35876/g.55064 Transcript_35876/m.55064 type:complete len:83 (+) Transcript_35876:955-1203(+)
MNFSMAMSNSAANDQRGEENSSPITSANRTHLIEEMKESSASNCTTKSLTKYRSHVFDMYSIANLHLVLELNLDELTQGDDP